MHGNMLSRWTNFLTSDGEKEWRKRDAEFEEQKLSKEQLENIGKQIQKQYSSSLTDQYEDEFWNIK